MTDPTGMLQHLALHGMSRHGVGRNDMIPVEQARMRMKKWRVILFTLILPRSSIKGFAVWYAVRHHALVTLIDSRQTHNQALRATQDACDTLPNLGKIGNGYPRPTHRFGGYNREFPDVSAGVDVGFEC